MASPSPPLSVHQPAPPTNDGNEALRQLINERADRLASGDDKPIPHDEFWGAVEEDFKDLFGVYPDEVEDE